ncbi:hypothetical protein CALVIDRAFT_552979 [Calocera viscosa TUFC12733]|uniref:Protein CPL1-like domain-containing protein n=1 Tax=Calocera viscosa (strain TUFC12733) TaxID=1330018 RepID=A0A167QRB4_CALVF|nr:hypothetical protein CALVIDRAFT_552979 [Calocera viscosa TUFC12733]
MFVSRLSAVALVVSSALAGTIGWKRDICGLVDADLTLDTLGVLNVDYGHIGPICLCISGLSDFLTTNAIVAVPVQLLGAAEVEAALGVLIGGSPVCNSSPSTRKRDTYVFNDNMCPKGQSLCGIQSSWTKTDWECIDTKTDLESCGGCVLGVMGTPGDGVDCTAIEGVEDVACAAGHCQVFSCASGFRVSDCGTTCVRTSHHT